MAKKIVIVDDEADIVKILTYRLKAKGYEVFSAANGEDGLALIDKERPGLILLDLRLPGMDGLEVTKELRKKVALKDTPIILITANIENVAQKAREYDLDYMTKPIDPKILYEKVEKYMGGAT